MTVQDMIVVEGVGKLFRRSSDRPHTMSEQLVRGWRRRQPPEEFWALRDVSFRVGRGQAFGVIGNNGAGKSTLLRLVAGIGRATEGRLQTRGRIRALLDLGSSFHHELTGRENVFVAGVVAGLTRREVRERFPAIVAFAELERFIESPVRKFSTGMLMRLAFSVAVHTDPEILLVDEVLAVGDVGFQYKCLDRIEQFKQNGCTVLLVSHDMSTMQRLCDDMLWLRGGRVEAHGTPKQVIERYLGESMAETRRRTVTDRPAAHASSGHELRMNENRFGSLEIEISAVRVLDADGEPVGEVEPGSPVNIDIEYKTSQPISCPHFGVSISRADEFVCYEVTTAADGHVLPELNGSGRIGLLIERLDLAAGDYFVNVSVYEREWSYSYDVHWHVYPLRVRASTVSRGLLSVPHRWRFELNGGSGAPEPGTSPLRHERSAPPGTWI
jgi:homopolymeric O-antigen transport system ATP-binding protein